MNRIEDIRKWGMDRNIIQGTRPEKQFIKLMEEVGELGEGIVAVDKGIIYDGIGDAVVVFVMISAQTGVNIEEALIEARGKNHAIHSFSGQSMYVKLIAEIGVLAAGLAKNKPEKIMAGIGNSMEILSELAVRCGSTLDHCVELAWQEIKDRKGEMVDGIFVKEADLKPCHNSHCECEQGACTHPGYRDARHEEVNHG